MGEGTEMGTTGENLGGSKNSYWALNLNGRGMCVIFEETR